MAAKVEAPFRIGSTSYVFPDDILPNVRKLAGIVDDVELVLFEVDEFGSNLPSDDDIAELESLALEYDLTYTVHLPLDLRNGDERGLDKTRRVIETTLPLDPWAFVMHLDGRGVINAPNIDAINCWQAESEKVLGQITSWTGDAARVCVENVEAWDPSYFQPVVERTGVSRCVDVGHFWLGGNDPLPHLAANLPRTRVVHLHGIGSRDHQSLENVPNDDLESVLRLLVRESYRGVLTLEVFGVEDFFSSKEVLLKVTANLADSNSG